MTLSQLFFLSLCVTLSQAHPIKSSFLGSGAPFMMRVSRQKVYNMYTLYFYLVSEYSDIHTVSIQYNHIPRVNLGPPYMLSDLKVTFLYFTSNLSLTLPAAFVFQFNV